MKVEATAPVKAALAGALAERRHDPRTAATVAAAEVARLVREHGLAGPRELALLALPLAADLARPSISSYRVGVAGIDAAGDLVLGANLEFPSADLGATIHAEGFASLRARGRGTTLAVLALTEAHPCAHCRQTLAESATADELELIDPGGSALRLRDLYPWPFTPAALGVGGDDPSRPAWPDVELSDDGLADEVATPLRDAARRAHAPYSGCPSAVALRLRDGRILAAGCVESVSFNPTITAAQAALVELAAIGAEGADVEAGWVARVADAAVDPAPGARALFGAVAPGARFEVVEARPGGPAR